MTTQRHPRAQGIGRIFKWSFKGLLYVLSATISALYLLSVGAMYIPPTRWGIPALLGLLFPLFFVLQVALVLFWFIRFRWHRVLPLVVVLLLGWPALRAYFPINIDRREEPAEGQMLRILSYNVNGFGFKPHTPSSPNPTLQYLKASGADIICLQEAYLVRHDSQGITESDLNDYLGREYPYRHHLSAQKENSSTLLLLSRYPINRAERIALRSHYNGGALYSLQVGDLEVKLLNLHLESFRLSKLGQEYYLQLAKHNDRMGVERMLRGRFLPVFRLHNLQANQLDQLLNSIGRERTIICGDFNDTPVSYLHRSLSRGMQDAFVESGNGLGLTYNSAPYRVRIDHILCGSSFVPYAARVDRRAQFSDHYPITATLLWQHDEKEQKASQSPKNNP